MQVSFYKKFAEFASKAKTKVALAVTAVVVTSQNVMAGAAAGDFIPTDTVADIGIVAGDAKTVGGSMVGLVLVIAAIGIIISILKKR